MNRDFRNALDAVTAESTPQPWDWTDPNGATLTVIPDGLKSDPGEAEVTIRVTASKVLGTEIGITTTDLPDLINALTNREPWEQSTLLDGLIAVEPAATGDDTVLVITGTYWDGGRPLETHVAIRLPEAQRLPLASALRRALDVALGWED